MFLDLRTLGVTMCLSLRISEQLDILKSSLDTNDSLCCKLVKKGRII